MSNDKVDNTEDQDGGDDAPILRHFPASRRSASGGLRSMLRQATHADHVRLNGHPLLAPLTRPQLTRPHYGRVLVAYFHFYRCLEARIDQAEQRLPGALPYAERRKTPWLASDLVHLGLAPGASAPAPMAAWDVGPIDGLGALAGVLYAVEGSTLGGQVIGRHLAGNLGLTSREGARFFNAYGAETESRWQAFLAWLEGLAMEPEERQQAGLQAGNIFSKLEILLDAYHQAPVGH